MSSDPAVIAEPEAEALEAPTEVTPEADVELPPDDDAELVEPAEPGEVELVDTPPDAAL